nr:integrase, catalytic region, zinc finger, CCHC-type, peptidase aspartic, catalytic [Tanacetum cinerariifolium]
VLLGKSGGGFCRRCGLIEMDKEVAGKGVIHRTNVCRPQLRSSQMKDKVVPNTTQIVHLILFIVESGCTKHMTGNLKLMCNFVKKYLGTVRFRNNQLALILGYEDLAQGNIRINRVYYIKGLNHNLFSVGQFFDADLEVTFRKSTCFVRDLHGNELLLKDIVTGLPKMKHIKDQLCSSCEVIKAKRSAFRIKYVPSSKGRLNLLHMDLCGPMQVASINGKKYILEEVYVTQPDGFVNHPHPETFYLLMKALYGLKQASRSCRFEMSLMGKMLFFFGLQIHQFLRVESEHVALALTCPQETATIVRIST